MLNYEILLRLTARWRSLSHGHRFSSVSSFYAVSAYLAGFIRLATTNLIDLWGIDDKKDLTLSALYIQINISLVFT